MSTLSMLVPGASGPRRYTPSVTCVPVGPDLCPRTSCCFVPPNWQAHLVVPAETQILPRSIRPFTAKKALVKMGFWPPPPLIPRFSAHLYS